jgi:hypothetical protein
MTLSGFGNLVGIGVVVVAVAGWAFATEQKVRNHHEILDAVQRTQQEIIDWQSEQIRKERDRQTRERVIRELCNQGKLPPEDCEVSP